MALSLKPLNEQIMVITGASSGIGLATAHEAALRGAKLVLAARSEQTLKEIVEHLNLGGAEAIYVMADVGNREQVQRIADEAIRRFGRIDTWVNDAGVSIYGKIEEVSDEDNRRLFDTNFWGVVNGTLLALPHLKKQGGALINVGSEVSDAVIPLQGMYAASKHAVKGFTDSLRVELEMENAPVSVTLIQPTAVDTPYPQHARNYMDKEPALPAPQIDPEQVAEAILEAATKPMRDVKVGMMAKVNTTVAKVAPRVGDWFSQRIAKMQEQEQRPRNPQGTLFEAGEEGRTHGSWPVRSE